MTDKKKKRARSISQKTGMSHQAAVNTLNANVDPPSDVVTVEMHQNKVRILLNGQPLSGVSQLKLTADSSGHQLISMKLAIWGEASREVSARLKKVPYVSVEEELVQPIDPCGDLLDGNSPTISCEKPKGHKGAHQWWGPNRYFSKGTKSWGAPLPDDSSVQVTKVYSEVGSEGPGWYLWETECPEEGHFHFGISEPTLEDIQAICPEYVFETP